MDENTIRLGTSMKLDERSYIKLLSIEHFTVRLRIESRLISYNQFPISVGQKYLIPGIGRIMLIRIHTESINLGLVLSPLIEDEASHYKKNRPISIPR